MHSTMMDLAKDEVACTGVRGIQGMRRSRSRAASTSSLAGKQRSKVRSAKEYLNKNGLEGDLFAATLLKCTSGSFGIDVQLPPLTNKLKMTRALPVQRIPVEPLPSSITTTEKPSWTFYSQEPESYEDLYSMSMGDADEFDGKSNKALEDNYIMDLKRQNCRRFYCQDILTYEDFYNLVGNDQEEFDDQHLNTQVNRPRHFFCKEISSYDELYNIVGDDQGFFDDEHFQLTPLSEPACEEFTGRHLYGNEIHSYEEFYNLAGGDGEVFDDEVLMTKECRTFYGNEIESYEEFFNLAGGERALFDDEYLARHSWCKGFESY